MDIDNPLRSVLIIFFCQPFCRPFLLVFFADPFAGFFVVPFC
ncbi:hypothetical protein [Hespellia stercorisuis]|nr:hypothetical protein [Hespellia stercorisuis]